MDMSTFSFLNTWLSGQTPVLPSPTAMRVALPLVWAIILGSGTWFLAGKLERRYRLGLVLLVMAWTGVPGAASPAYWLGLAFQTPSLSSGALCLVWFLRRTRQAPGSAVASACAEFKGLKVLAALGVGLGWVLLLDTLAWTPVSIYAWGFGSAALAWVAVLATLLWAVWGSDRKDGLIVPVMLLGVLALFVLTRLPTGNLWDALIDPWLWIGLQAGWLLSVARRLMAWARQPPATRA
jgi:hypothetical protein